MRTARPPEILRGGGLPCSISLSGRPFSGGDFPSPEECGTINRLPRQSGRGRKGGGGHERAAVPAGQGGREQAALRRGAGQHRRGDRGVRPGRELRLCQPGDDQLAQHSPKRVSEDERAGLLRLYRRVRLRSGAAEEADGQPPAVLPGLPEAQRPHPYAHRHRNAAVRRLRQHQVCHHHAAGRAGFSGPV